ncbi:MAG: type II secretion system protein, partial [Planctomycetota bacterium]
MRARPRGFTLIELLVVIAIIALLIGILLPTLGKAQEAGLRLACASNVKSHALALNMYANDHQERLPIARVGLWETFPPPLATAPYLQDVLIPYVEGVFGEGNYSDV